MKLMKVIMMSATFAIGCAVNAAEQAQVEHKKQAELKRSRSTGSICTILQPGKKLSAILEINPLFTKGEQQDLKLVREKLVKPASSKEVIDFAEQGIQQEGSAHCEFADALRYTLLLSVRMGKCSVVKRLLERSNFLRANIATRLHSGENYLCECTGDTLYSIAARLGHKKTLKNLLDYRCFVVKKSFIQDQEISCLDIENNHGDTPLIIAARQNHCECVKQLIQAGADTMAENRQGETAIKVTTSPAIKKALEQAIKEQKEREAKAVYSGSKTA